ncbi:MAG: glycosyltransferase family 2 protein [Vicinamibacteria bacterium]|nr:glycosyltransferase family 2 protein [Vicinamibacteria bacterium]
MIETVALIPAFDERRTIGDVVRQVSPFVAKVIVIDDGSRDGTGQLARAAGADVVQHATNQGKGAALRSGLRRALDGPYSHVLILDGDMQHVPAEAGRLLQVAQASGVDLVVGERSFDRRTMPASRYYANRVGSSALSRLIGMDIRDTQSGFRVFRADLLRRMALRATGYEVETEMLVKAGRLGARVVGVPVSAVYGTAVSKLRPVRDTTRTCLLAVYYRFIERL